MMPIVKQAMFDLIPGAGALGSEAVSSPRVVVLQAGANGVTLSIADNGDSDAQRHVFGPGWRGLAVLDRVDCGVLEGSGTAYDIDIAALAKLQAFLDAAQSAVRQPTISTAAVASAGNDDASMIAVAFPAIFPTALDSGNWADIERWFLDQSARIDTDADTDADVYARVDFSYIAVVLRSTEHYKLVRFLLSQPASRSIQELSVEYGLSYSHFRKLCRAALGRGGKAEFQYWRNVRALLDLIDGGGNLTDVALRQGFASSSHFSDAMKGQFGIAPRYLTRALTLEKQ